MPSQRKPERRNDCNKQRVGQETECGRVLNRIKFSRGGSCQEALLCKGLVIVVDDRKLLNSHTAASNDMG
jgi:hypothetical protein